MELICDGQAYPSADGYNYTCTIKGDTFTASVNSVNTTMTRLTNGKILYRSVNASQTGEQVSVLKPI